MKLISMTDFVLEQNTEFTKDKPIHETDWNLEFEKFSKLTISYAKFLKQPLKLEMFIPCDDNGNILKDPGLIPSYELEQYRKAKEKVLFEHTYNLTYLEIIVMDRCKIIEDLLKLNLSSFQLNSNGIKQIGL